MDKDKFCNNERDCVDFSDEICFGDNCGENQFSCSSDCFPNFKKCNGKKDCINGWDELNTECLNSQQTR